MSKRAKIVLGSIAGLLIVISVLAKALKDDTFDIMVITRPSMAKTEYAPVAIGFTKAVRPTSIKVVEAEQAKTNKYPRALWHLVSDGKPRSMKGFFYGEDEKLKQHGLFPKVTNSIPEALEPGVEYLLLVQTDSFKTQTNFVARRSRVVSTRK